MKQYVKMDLHVHTACSTCFQPTRGTEVPYAKQVVDAAIASGCKAIAVTDHMTGEAIDDVKQAAQGTDLVVFPGVEISAASGPKYVHILALFPENRSSQDVSFFVGNIIDPQQPLYSKFNAVEVIKKIAQAGGLAVLAHPDGETGINKSEGQPRRDALHAKELAACEYSAELRSDPEFSHIAQYRASDGGAATNNGRHTIEGIGENVSRFNVDGVNFESLRQCLVDPATRISVDAPSASGPPPRITHVSVSRGFMQGGSIDFHSGLTAILGGKGVGKSLVVEFLRFALDQPLSLEDNLPALEHEALAQIVKDHDRKLDKCLGAGGKVTVRFCTGAGTRYEVTREYDQMNNAITVTNLERSDTVKGANLRTLFPVIFFSQREIMLLAECPTALMRWLDQALAIHADAKDVTTVEDLGKNDQLLARAIRAQAAIEEELAVIANLEEQLDGIRKQVDSPTAKKMDLCQKRKAVFGDVLDRHERLGGLFAEVTENIQGLSMPALEGDLALDDAPLLASIQVVETFVARALGVLRDMQQENERLLAWQHDVYAAFQDRMRDVEKAYVDEMGAVPTSHAKLRVELRQLEEQLANHRRQIADQKRIADSVPQLLEQRTKLLDAFFVARRAVSEEREKRLLALAAKTGGRLRLELRKGQNKSGFVSAVIAVKTSVRRDAIEKVATSIPMPQFVDMCIAKNAARIKEDAKVTEGAATGLVDALTDPQRLSLETLLSWQYTVLAEDIPIVKYRAQDGSFKVLTDLSVGQKSSALTVLALCEGDSPVVIDQPEDSLDVVGVWEDVVQRVRSEKERRQFIFTTHNSTVAVAGDSDSFVILSANAEKGSIRASGAIEHDDVKGAVIQHLEGGKDPYILKQRKYGTIQ